MTQANDKPFEQIVNDKYDRPGKLAAIQLLERMGYTNIKENKEWLNGFVNIFDLEAWKDGKRIIVEVEVKEDWGTVWFEDHPNQKMGWLEKAFPFPYSTAHFPYRKRGSATREMVTHHMMIGGDFKRAFIIKRAIVLKSRIIICRPRNRNGEKEPFFDPCVGQGYFFELHDKWILIKPKPTPEIDLSYLQ